MSKTYFIDSENVGDNWIALLSVVSKEEDELLVFYTAKSPHMNYKNVILLKQSDIEVTFIECCEGNNALDFQLCTELGFRIPTLNNDGEFIIVSNDTGFDAVVRYWRKREKSVKRIPGKACASLSRCIPPSVPENTALTPVDNTISKDSNICLSESSNSYLLDKINEADKIQEEITIDDNAKEILFLIGRNNLQQLHEALKQLYGPQKGKFIYDSFKTDTSYDTFSEQHKSMDLLEKWQSYCTIVFSSATPAEKSPKDFSKFLIQSWTQKQNLNSLKASLQQKYGKEKGQRYYSLFKVHIKILANIK